MYLGRLTQEYQQNIIIVKLLDFKDKEKIPLGNQTKSASHLLEKENQDVMKLVDSNILS